MSIEAHPNLHAAGLTVDIIEAVEQRVRGKAATLPPQLIADLTNKRIVEFVLTLSMVLDQAVEGGPKFPGRRGGTHGG